jgi:polar amino acid transport system substrate-binding protein
MARLIALRGFLYVAVAATCALSGDASFAEPLRLVTDRLVPFEDLSDENAPGFSVEVLRQAFASMGQDVHFETFPYNRNWIMVLRGERDGLFSGMRTHERERICHYPDEPLKQEKWVLFVRTADVGRLKFSSFDDLVGHQVAVHEPAPGVLSQPNVSPEMWKFLREHHNVVETSGNRGSLRMLAAGRVDYAVANLSVGMREIVEMGLSGKLEPLLSRNVIENGYHVCFSKARVAPAFVEAFSGALKQFKQTGEFQGIYRKYFP